MTAICIALLTTLSIAYTCPNVRRAVNSCGIHTVIAQARNVGATEQHIQAGLRCLGKK